MMKHFCWLIGIIKRLWSRQLVTDTRNAPVRPSFCGLSLCPLLNRSWLIENLSLSSFADSSGSNSVERGGNRVFELKSSAHPVGKWERKRIIFGREDFHGDFSVLWFQLRIKMEISCPGERASRGIQLKFQMSSTPCVSDVTESAHVVV